MSIDLFVVRDSPEIAEAELDAALSALSAANDGVTLSLDETRYWGVRRVAIDYIAPAEDEVEEEQLQELRVPYVIVSSRSGAWPWIDFTAVVIAKKLGGRIYDPQQDEFYETLEPEHDIVRLRALHDADAKERAEV